MSGVSMLEPGLIFIVLGQSVRARVNAKLENKHADIYSHCAMYF
jgi:hypothetical protein